MAHEVKWLKPGRLLYVSYQGHQTPEALKACLNDMADQLDTVTYPVMILINWLEVTDSEPRVLQSQPVAIPTHSISTQWKRQWSICNRC